MIHAYPVQRISLMLNSRADKALGAAFKYRPGINQYVFIGNSLRGDDGIAPYILQNLLPCKGVRYLDAGINPERIIDEAVSGHPVYTLFIDAADFNGRPGETVILKREDIPERALSTHMIPVSVIAALIESETGCETGYLGIQAVATGYEPGLSPEVKKTADRIIALINASSETTETRKNGNTEKL